MSRSAGPGSPVWFMCPEIRKMYDAGDRYLARERHLIKRTGNWKPRPGGGPALGQRSLLGSWEYVCSCGHKGWTNHIDILHHPFKPGVEPIEICSHRHCGAPVGRCRHGAGVSR